MFNIVMSSPMDGDNGLAAFCVLVLILAVGCVYDHWCYSRKYFANKIEELRLRKAILASGRRITSHSRMIDVVKADYVSCFLKNGDIVTLIMQSGEVREYVFHNADEGDDVFWLDDKKVTCTQMLSFLKKEKARLVKF